MSVLAEIAARADVPLEAVLGVLAREPVDDEHKRRVLEVLEELDQDETRAVQRFALAAVHDAPPAGRAARSSEEAVEAELVGPLEPEWDDTSEIEEAEVSNLPAAQAAFDPTPLVQLRSVLGELAEAVRDLRRETDAERRDRVDDLAVLIDLITKGWQGVDRRLGTMESRLERIESAPRQPSLIAATPVEPPPVPDPEPPPPPPEGDPSTLRKRLPVIAALVVGIAIGAIAALDLPSRLDASTVPAEQTEQTVAPAAGRSLPTTAARLPGRPPATPAPRTTAEPQATTAARTTQQPPPTRTQAPRATQPPRAKQPPRTTRAPARPTTTSVSATKPSRPFRFTPSRNWAWPPAPGADYYLVEFFQGDRPLYRARPTVPQLTLPPSIEFVPGVYRWRVRPGRGAPSANRLDRAIVDSRFVVG